MVEFLSGASIVRAISDGLHPEKSADLAVAFWGKNAAKQLGLDRTKGPIRIICDAESGCCNPNELKSLIRKKSFHVKASRGLHAKVFILPSYVVIGSANASSNGLGDESSQTGNIEAVALVSDREFRAAVMNWFNEVWSSPSSYDITEPDVERIRALWARRQRNQPKEPKDAPPTHPGGPRRKILNVLDKKGSLLRRWKTLLHKDGSVIWGDWFRPDKYCDIIRVYETAGGRSLVGGSILETKVTPAGSTRVYFRVDKAQRGKVPPNRFRQPGCMATYD